MRMIWKYRLEIVDKQTLQIPAPSKIVHVGLDPNGELCLWAVVTPTVKPRPVVIGVFGTGNPVNLDLEEYQHLGSVVQGIFIWHVYQLSV